MDAGGDKMATNAAVRRSNLAGKRKRGPFAKVKFGSAVVPIYESHSNGRIRYCFTHYRDGKRLRQFFSDLDSAKKEAQFVAPRSRTS